MTDFSFAEIKLDCVLQKISIRSFFANRFYQQSMEQQTLNPYYELGVEPGVTPQQLKQAYRQSVMRYHPDTSSGSGNARKFRQVTEAYQLLQKMNAYQSTHAEKKTDSRASNLRKKFSSVFQ